LSIDHWGDATKRDNVKFWAGSGGYPGCGLLRDALDLVRARMAHATADPFSLAAPQSSSFRFDWRRDYVPMDVGFSPNKHSDDIVMVGFPLVEILAAIGLGNARPARQDKLTYRYAVIGGAPPAALFSPIFLRAALGVANLPFPRRIFRMHLDWPGQENQARCITDVVEEERP
jgi:CRISPR-associated protein Csx14